jgi:hypothetical protein
MVRWVDTQALFGATLALNLGYYALSEIRKPSAMKLDLEAREVTGSKRSNQASTRGDH